MRLYWAVGLTLAAAGYLLGKAQVAPSWAGFVGAGIEAIFAVIILLIGSREVRTLDSSSPTRSEKTLSSVS
jgi:hypothetical protein